MSFKPRPDSAAGAPADAPKKTGISFSMAAKPAKPGRGAKQAIRPVPLGLGKRPAAGDGPAAKKRRDDEPEHEMITGFDMRTGAVVAGGGASRTQGRLVIPAVKNRDWREEAGKRRGVSYVPEGANLPPEARAAEQRRLEELEAAEARRTFGLRTMEGARAEAAEAAQAAAEEKAAAAAAASARAAAAADAAAPAAAPASADERAIRDIIAEIGGDGRPRSTRTIAVAASAGRVRPLSEDDAYRRDVEARPDVPSLDQYEAVPVEEFGLALLRGMGYKDDEDPAAAPAERSRRPAFLGLGAKPFEPGSK
ncbi:DExH-box splicing factor binding site-domain-containing protein [Dipodascopsis tothii]|uniref:DExH-box splicing factor binding site-domain-containing protein n=1 Tax=Dipodascopsis tothii TaxID=44089 RepID=UPI0034CE9C7F